MKILSWLIALIVSITFSLSSFANPKKIGYIVNYMKQDKTTKKKMKTMVKVK